MRHINSTPEIIKQMEYYIKYDDCFKQELLEKDINPKDLVCLIDELLCKIEAEKNFNTVNIKFLISEFNFKINSKLNNHMNIGYGYILYIDLLYAIVEVYEEKLKLEKRLISEYSNEINCIYSSIDSFSKIITGVTFVNKSTKEETYIIRRSEIINFISNINIDEYELKISRLDNYGLNSSNGVYRMKDKYLVDIYGENFNMKSFVKSTINNHKSFEDFHYETLSLLDTYSTFEKIKEVSDKISKEF